MKRAIAIIFAVIVLLLCGCSNKVEEAKMLFDAGDYQGAIEVADEVLSEDSDSEVTSEATEIKAKSLYEIQKKAYDERNFSNAVKCYVQIKELGLDTSVYYPSQKIDLVISAEQELETMQKMCDSGLWDNAIDCEKEIQRLVQQSAMSYGDKDELNSRMEEIVSESEVLSNEAQLGRWYDEFLNCVEIGYVEGAVKAAEVLHNDWPGSEEDLAAQEYLPQALEQIEQERAAEEQRLKDTIRVRRVWTSNPDSAGGVELYINFTNMSDKTIKYVTFGVKLYNAVGDVVECKYDNALFGVYYCKDTGPYEKGEGLSGTSWHWGDFYNWDIDHAELVSVEIEYMDGTETEIDGDDIGIIQY